MTMDQEFFYTYTPEQEIARAEIIALIKAEQRAYYERCEPLVKRLAAIEGTPHFIVNVSEAEAKRRMP